MGDRREAKVLLDATKYDGRQLRKDLSDYIRNNPVGGAEAQAIQDLLSDERARERAAAEVRAQAAVALAYVNSEAAVKRLAVLMGDDSAIVRVAAASAILRGLR